MNTVYHRSALDVLSIIDNNSVDLAYLDVPFGTGHDQVLTRKKGGKILSKISYEDPNHDYITWLQIHMLEIRRVLKTSGTVYLHLDHHWVHHAKVMLDDEI